MTPQGTAQLGLRAAGARRPGSPGRRRNALHWVAKASRPLAELAEPAMARAVLDSLKIKLDGTAAAAETVRRKRRTLVNAMNYAVDLGEFRENPITSVRWQKPKVSNEVDPRVVANPEQARSPAARRLLRRRLPPCPWPSPRGSVCLHVLRWLRPAEVVGLAETDLRLPDVGLGLGAAPPDTPERRQAVDRLRGDPRRPRSEESADRGRPAGAHSASPRRHAPRAPRAPSGLRTTDGCSSARMGGWSRPRPTTASGRRLGTSRFRRPWWPRRSLRRPYDLRHSALSTWLNAGVDPDRGR